MTTARSVLPVALALGLAAAPAGPRAPMVRETVRVDRRTIAFRLEPRFLSARDACDAIGDGDLRARIDGRLATIHDLERAPGPARVWILIDASVSASYRRRISLRSVRDYLTTLFDPRRVEAAVVAVGDDTVLLEGPSSDRDALLRSLDGVADDRMSLLRDGVTDVLRAAAAEPDEQWLLFWTDGHDALSAATEDDLLAAWRSAPAMRILPVGFAAQGSGGRLHLAAPLLHRIAEASGGELLPPGPKEWIGALESWARRRWTATLASDAGPLDGPVEVTTPDRPCRVVVLPYPPPAGDEAHLSATPPEWLRAMADRGPAELDRSCPSDPGRLPELGGTDGRIEGCIVDVVGDRGLKPSRASPTGVEEHGRLALAIRRVRVEVPPVERAPTRPEEVLDRLAASAEGRGDGPRDARIVHGRALLASRTALADALARHAPEHCRVALKAAARRVRRRLEEISREIGGMRGWPEGADPSRLAGETFAGRRLLSTSSGPAGRTDALAAWLGDVSARDAFARWERDAIDRWLAGDEGAAARVLSAWPDLRESLGVPDAAHVAAPLVLARDPATNRFGFFRFVRPRLEGVRGRAIGLRPSPSRLYDLVPEVPLALATVVAAGERDPALVAAVRAGRFHVTEARVESLTPMARASSRHPYGRARVTVGLEGAGGTVLGWSAETERVETGRYRVGRVEISGPEELGSRVETALSGRSLTTSAVAAAGQPTGR